MGIKKAATMMDVAKRAGVSVATVARVIHGNGYVSQEKRALIEKAISELGYFSPKKDAPAVNGNLVGVWTPSERENPFFAYLPHALALEANRCGLYIVVQVQRTRNEYLEEVVARFTRMCVCGIVIVGFEDATLREDLREVLLDCGVPVVFIERTARSYGLNRVLLDGGEGIYLAARHLIDRGHRQLLYTGTAPLNDVDLQRLRGYQNAMAEIGVPDPPIVNTMKSGSIQEGYESARIGLQRWPETTAIVAWSDLYAIGAMQYCFDTGRRIPADIAITGFDDIYARAAVPPLTSVTMPLEEMAQAAISMIIENQDQTMDFYAKTITLSPKLVVRKSSG